MVNKTCLECGVEIAKGYRCTRHTKAKERARNALPRRQAYRDPVYKSFIKDNKCANCGSTIDLTKDHRLALINSGTNNHNNLGTLCRSCNSAKGALIQ